MTKFFSINNQLLSLYTNFYRNLENRAGIVYFLTASKLNNEKIKRLYIISFLSEGVLIKTEMAEKDM